MATKDYSDSFLIRYCKVESVEDDAMGYRLKVRIPYYDPSFGEDPLMENIPYCFPLLPKLLHVYPKVGEMVFVILQEQGSTRGDRFFIGPVISQDYYLNYCDSMIDATTLLQGVNLLPPKENPTLNPENDGTIPDREDVAIRGRMNADMVLLDNELRLRCGFGENAGETDTRRSLNFNDKDMAYLQMKYFTNGKTDSHGEYNSVANIVADRINLISHDGKPFIGNVDTHDMITPEMQDKIQAECHSVPYGEELMEHIRKLTEIFVSHVHPFHGKTPCLIGSEIETINTDLTKYLSKTVKIN